MFMDLQFVANSATNNSATARVLEISITFVGAHHLCGFIKCGAEICHMNILCHVIYDLKSS